MRNCNVISEDVLAQMIDHTNLHADASYADMKKLCEEAMQYHFRMTAVNSCQTHLCHEFLKNSDVHVGAAAGFPLGQQTIAVKVFEARDAIENGADEIDYVINITELKEGHTDYIREEMKQMVSLCRSHHVICKVIFETCYLSEEEIIALSKIASEIQPDYIKTSTGFGTAGAKAEHVRLMKQHAGPYVRVKAAGGIRTLSAALEMIEAGAERIGTSSGVRIMQELSQHQRD
ncbi:MAG: deoxyribose-phosphate aldolase [Erysipelotrichaceae bacterium]|nr:deoxyribose-phosphate aldolase [Erysipelotrichaceae bacterium]